MTQGKTLCLLDGMALVYRAHFAFIKNPRITAGGLNTSAMFGFVNTLADLREQLKPTHLAVAFDTPEPTPRHEWYPEYKAHREAMPEDLSAALPYVDKLLAAMRIPVLRAPGFEADDLICTLAKLAEAQDFTTYMVTPDKDFAQAVSERILLHRPLPKGMETLDVAGVCQKFGVSRPEQVIDLLGLMGDAADNIPGIRGVGEKTAVKLIAEYDSIENLLAHADELKGKLAERVRDGHDAALMSKRLATIILDVPCATTIDELILQEPNEEQLKALFTELEFRNLGKRWFGEEFTLVAETVPGSETPSGEAGEPDLFDMAPAASTLATRKHDYQIVDTPDGRRDLVATLLRQPLVCFDLETTDLDPSVAEIVGVALAWQSASGYYIPVPPGDAGVAVMADLLPLFASPDVVKLGHNLKYDISVLIWRGLPTPAPLADSMLAHYVISPELRHGMDYLAETLLGYAPQPITALIGTGKDQISMRDVPIAAAAEYAVEDADVTLQLWQALEPQLAEFGVDRVYREVEVPLLPVLVAMERAGIRCDTGTLVGFSAELQEEITRLETSIQDQAGFEFNIDSPKQLGEVLFDHLKLEAKPKKTKTGQYATNEQVLSYLAPKHEIVRNVLEYREMRKLKNTYVDQLPTFVNARTGRLHTTYNQAVTATGRLQSNNPNLQNIPVRSEKGREIRKAFIARDDEHRLLSADYSQVELRIIAHISGDDGLRDAFMANLDIHTATAARIYHVDLDEVQPEMRRKAKMVNFGIAYGISAFGLSQRLGIARKEAAEIIDNYFAQFPGVKDYIDTTIEKAGRDGYVETLLGRRRYLRDITSRNATNRASAERNAINAPIQGTAADLIKLAMIRIHNRMIAEGLRSQMLLQVHDELVFDCRLDEAETLMPLVRQEMEGAMTLSVPLTVEMGLGKNWLEAH